MLAIDNFNSKMDTLQAFYDENRNEIEASTKTKGDRSYYIFKLLRTALNCNADAVAMTRTIPNDAIAREVQKERKLMDDAMKYTVDALCEIIKLNHNVDSIKKETQEWKYAYLHANDGDFECGGF